MKTGKLNSATQRRFLMLIGRRENDACRMNDKNDTGNERRIDLNIWSDKASISAKLVPTYDVN